MQIEVGMVLEGKVAGITNFGAFVDFPDGKTGMIHISEVSSDFVRDINDYLKVGQAVRAKVISISEKNEIRLSIKQLMPAKTGSRDRQHQGQSRGQGRNFGRASTNNRPERRGRSSLQETKKGVAVDFEEMLQSFKHKSEEKISDLKRATESKRGGFSRRGTQH